MFLWEYAFAFGATAHVNMRFAHAFLSCFPFFFSGFSLTYHTRHIVFVSEHGWLRCWVPFRNHSYFGYDVTMFSQHKVTEGRHMTDYALSGCSRGFHGDTQGRFQTTFYGPKRWWVVTRQTGNTNQRDMRYVCATHAVRRVHTAVAYSGRLCV